MNKIIFWYACTYCCVQVYVYVTNRSFMQVQTRLIEYAGLSTVFENIDSINHLSFQCQKYPKFLLIPKGTKNPRI